jgi:hypothetical protein
MYRYVIVLCSLFFVLGLVVVQISCAKVTPGHEVMVSTRDGESIRGKLVSRTDSTITVERQGQVLSFFVQELSSLTNQTTGETERFKAKRPFSTAVITYQINSPLSNATETYYLDISNNRFVIEQNMEISMESDNRPKASKRKIYDGKKVVTIQHNSGFVVEEKYDDIMDVFLESMCSTNPQARQRKETFLGKECLVYILPDGNTASFWQGILMKSTNAIPGMGAVEREVRDLQLDVPIPVEKFAIPAHVKIESADEIMQNFMGALQGLEGSNEKPAVRGSK